MQKKFGLTHVGQQITVADIDTLADGSLADDAVFRDLLTLADNELRVIPAAGQALMTPGTGKVTVGQFRALVGADPGNGRALARSAIFAGQDVTFADGTGLPRWDLICAVVAIDANGPSDTRKVKGPGSGVVTAMTVPTYKQTSVTLSVTQGTPAVTPAFPATPASSSTTYYIPLAYVCITTTFTSATVIHAVDIAPAAPVNRGASVATSNYAPGGAMLSAAKQGSWGVGAGRPVTFMPPTMGGGIEVVMGAVDLTTGSESHANGSVIDTRDWRKRLVRWTAAIATAGGTIFPWESSAAGPNFPLATGTFSYYQRDETLTSNVHHGMGETFTTSVGGTPVDPIIMALTPFGGISAGISCDRTTGQLKITYSANPNVKFLYWLEFSPRFENAE